MGNVYVATEVALGRIVAIKVLAPTLASGEYFRMRFEREARAAAAISHSNVVKVYTVGEIPGAPPLPYIIMQYVEGTALDGLLKEKGPLPERRARVLLRDVAAGLAAAHQRELVHRDIKPANILIEHGSGQAYLVDFGISAALSSRALGGAEPLSEMEVIIGTPPYMSPEQTMGDTPGVPSDVYSLGVVAYEVLSGRLPFIATSDQGWRAAHCTMTPPPLRELRKGISDDLVRLVERCMDKDPEGRPSADRLAREFLPSSEHEILWPPPGLTSLPQRGRRLRLMSALLSASAVVLLGVLAVRLPGVQTGAGWWNAWASGSVIASDAAQNPNAWLVVLWQALAIVSALGLAIGLGGFVYLLVMTGDKLREFRSRGWTGETIIDALADPDGRTGLLLAGAGEFADPTPAERDRIRGFRRAAHGGLVLGAAWVALMVFAWALSALIGRPLQPRGGVTAGFYQLLVVTLPLALALLATVKALRDERRATGRTRRRSHSAAFHVPSESGIAEVTAWYAELPGNASPSPARPLPRGLLLGASSAVGLLTIWTIATLSLLLVATLLAGRFARELGGATAPVARLVEYQDERKSLPNTLSILRPFLPSAAQMRGLYATRDTIGFQSPSSLAVLSGDHLPAYPVDPRRALGSQQPDFAATTLVTDAIRRANALSADTLQMLAALAEHSRTRVLRSAAHTPDVRLPIESEAASSIRSALEGNAAGAVVATANRDFSGAEQRLGENAVIAELAVSGPGRHWPETGLRMLHSLVLLPLAEVERMRGNRPREAQLRAAATSTAETIDRFGPTWTVGAIGLGSDPRDFRVLMRLRSDSTIPIGFRSAAIEASGDAVCLNPREWLAGADAARVRLLGSEGLVPLPFRSSGIGRILQRIRYCAALSRT